MKNLNLKTTLPALALPLLLLSGSALASDTSVNVDITATVIPVCYISASPATVDLGSIPVTAFNGVAAGNLLSGISAKSVTLTPECYGATGASISLTSNNEAASGGCLISAHESGGYPMQFCMYNGSSTSSMLIGMDTAPRTIDLGNKLTSPRVLTVAAAGNGDVAATGDHTATLTATITAE
ncbi:hypothetical protein JRY02_13520 [Enterobacter roggenkampii]|nr:hypothetical protein [Enterobacter roggenkampii]